MRAVRYLLVTRTCASTPANRFTPGLLCRVACGVWQHKPQAAHAPRRQRCCCLGIFCSGAVIVAAADALLSALCVHRPTLWSRWLENTVSHARHTDDREACAGVARSRGCAVGWGGWRKGRARCLAVVRLITPNEKVQIPKCMYTHERLMYKSLPEETERLVYRVYRFTV